MTPIVIARATKLNDICADFATDMTDSGAIRILNVIDDHATRTLVTRALEHYNMCVTSSCRLGLARHLRQNQLDLIILDIRHDRDEKLGLLPQILSASIPVIITDDHRCDPSDRVAAFELGADGYMSEPIGPRELAARIRAILRRRGRTRAPAARRSDRGGFRFGDLTLDLRTRHLTRSDASRIFLTNREYALLLALVYRAGQTLTREQLQRATRPHQDVIDRSIDVIVLRLRRKLETSPGAQRIIETKRGMGYAIAIAVERFEYGSAKKDRPSKLPVAPSPTR
jgi:two-component system OmpR family response regulator